MRLSAPDTTSGQTTPAQVAPLLKLKSGGILTNQDCSYTCNLHPTYQGSPIGMSWCILKCLRQKDKFVCLSLSTIDRHSFLSFSKIHRCPWWRAFIYRLPIQTKSTHVGYSLTCNKLLLFCSVRSCLLVCMGSVSSFENLKKKVYLSNFSLYFLNRTFSISFSHQEFMWKLTGQF